MLDVAAVARTDIDLVLRDLLVAGVPKARRLAIWILHDPIAAEDAVQEAALLAWRRRGDLRNPAAAEGWFTRILVNVCRSELRRRARPRIVELEGVEEGNDDRIHRHDELTRAICALSPDQQTLLALRFGRDLTVPQVAAAMGLREGTVKSRLHATLAQLRVTLVEARRREEAIR
jgi:RNA polymerase sigma-70 factor (ECF subfamily)